LPFGPGSGTLLDTLAACFDLSLKPQAKPAKPSKQK
jgi:hypothetical protein